MKKLIRGKKLQSLLKSINEKHPRGILVIESQFQVYLTNCDFQHLLDEVVSGKVTNQKVISDSLAATRKLIRHAEYDMANIRKCASFIRKKFPHAVFAYDHFAIDVHNLSREEIKYCLAKKGLAFTYYNR